MEKSRVQKQRKIRKDIKVKTEQTIKNADRFVCLAEELFRKASHGVLMYPVVEMMFVKPIVALTMVTPNRLTSLRQ